MIIAKGSRPDGQRRKSMKGAERDSQSLADIAEHNRML